MSRFRIGCSGWQYKHWKGDFYPADLPKREWLEYYAQRFDTVEVNNSCTPKSFLFAVKASQFLEKCRQPTDVLRHLLRKLVEHRTQLAA